MVEAHPSSVSMSVPIDGVGDRGSRSARLLALVKADRVFTCVLAVTVWASATTIQAGAQAVPSIRDSAGVRIVENPAPLIERGTVWATVDPGVSVAIGERDGPVSHVFVQIVGAFEMRDGSIVISDTGPVRSGSTRELRVFDADGEYRWSWGGPGEGPGEFSGEPVMSYVAPDTIVAWDYRDRRRSWFSLDEGLVREERYGGPPGALGNVFIPQNWRVHPDGSTAVIRLDRGPPPPSRRNREFDRSYSLVLVSAPDDRVAVIDGLPGGRSMYASSGVIGLHLPPFPSVEGSWGVRREPRSVVVADDSDGRWILSIYDFDGTRTASIRAGVPRTTVTGDVESGARAWMRLRAENVSSGDREGFLSSISGASMPDSAPAIGGLVVDRQDRLWVKRWTGPWETAGSDTYDVLDRDGRWLGTVDVDRSFGEILSIGDDHILFVQYDELDVPVLVRHELVRVR